MAVAPADENGLAGSSPSKVLIVDDDPAIISLLAKVLGREGFDTITAYDGEGGLALFLTRMEQIDAVVLDVRMPGLRGPEMLAKMRERKPDLPAVVISGYDLDAEGQPPDLDHPRTAFIPKPFSLGVLRETLTRLLAGEAG